MLAIFVNELHNNWDKQLRHIDFSYNNSFSAATSSAPYEVHMGRHPLLPLTSLERAGVSGHTRLARDPLAYRAGATDRQQREYDIDREQQALTVALVNLPTRALLMLLCACRYTSASTTPTSTTRATWRSICQWG